MTWRDNDLFFRDQLYCLVVNWRGNDLIFLETTCTAMISYAYPNNIKTITLKFLLKWAAKFVAL